MRKVRSEASSTTVYRCYTALTGYSPECERTTRHKDVSVSSPIICTPVSITLLETY